MTDNKEVLANIAAWQAAGFVHPLTCAVDSRHALLVGKELAGDVVLVCPTCSHVQVNIPWLPSAKELEAWRPAFLR